MVVELKGERRERLVHALRGFYLESFDEDLSAFRAEQLVDFFLAAGAPEVYNQAVQDARQWLQSRLDDLEGDVHVAPGPV